MNTGDRGFTPRGEAVIYWHCPACHRRSVISESALQASRGGVRVRCPLCKGHCRVYYQRRSLLGWLRRRPRVLKIEESGDKI